MTEGYLAEFALDGQLDERSPENLIHRAPGPWRSRTFEGLTIHVSPSTAFRQIGRTVIIGQIFGDLAVLQRADLHPDLLVAHCWGNYLALHMSESGHPTWLLRAPLGHLPVYTAAVAGRLWISSHVPELAAARAVRPQIDWSFVATHLAFLHLKTAQTGLVGIEELLGGQWLDLAVEPARRTMAWSPGMFVRTDIEIADFADASRSLADSIDEAVRCLADEGKVLLELSGGLDSSIIAAALARCEAEAQAITLSTGSAESDERIYAQAAADAASIALTLRKVGISNLVGPARSREARPGLPVILGAADEMLAKEGTAQAITAFFSGAGGDCVFATPNAAGAATDVAIRSGWAARSTWRTIEALARYHNASVWSVAGRARRRLARGANDPADWPRTRGYLADTVPLPDAPLHPWLIETSGMLPGKRDHVHAILASLAHVDGYPRHAIAPTRFPLLSQPVVETALRIPSWLWVEGGQDRAVARAAFTDRLSDLIRDRRSKGALDGYALAAIEQQAEELLSFLLDGHLARQGLLDLARVECALRERARRADPRAHLLLPLIDTESWLRAWLGDP
ncbi:asparagine synthase C-terminal domain-containing protein [Novosphingobium sp.]|uniref:asparagine synthase-related protein n=1 Tax=Novosphingobium sp. TaxID=1874826 RepID=UPI00261F3C57|nr:asparagine synthase C-terminal domain-containing protein [Novosphingobium sp.]